jgi:hypothetical protein
MQEKIEKLKISEMREELIKLGYSKNDFENLSKQETKQLLSNAMIAEVSLDSVVEENSPVQQVQTNQQAGQPEFASAEWSDYVMTLFQTNELENGMPKVDGLRRVAHRVFGPFDILTEVIQTPTIDNNNRATVIVRLQLGGGFSPNRIITGSADVFSGNTDKAFAKHPVATAETRAEGRALRKALCLTKVLAAEELHGAEDDEPDGNDARIVSSMLNSLFIMAQRNQVDLFKLAVSMGYDLQTLEDLTQQQGLAISNKITAFQMGKEKIPDNIKN